MKLWFIAAVAIVSSLALSSCSSSGGSNGNVVTRKPLPAGYDPSQCGNLCPDNGEAALYENLGIDRPVTSDLFGKRYNRATLDAVLAASITETQNYAIRDGINLFKIPAAPGATKFPLQYALDPAPDDLQKEWMKQSVGNSADSWLDGLCVVKGSNRSIMVREDAGRWTLVHEMMHANFARQRVLDKLPSDGALNQHIRYNFDQIENSLKQYDASKVQDDLLPAASAAADLPALQLELLSRNSLEEVAVESLLGEEYRAGRLKYVNTDALYSSAAYIEANENKSTSDIDLVEASLQRVKEKVAAAGLFDSANDLQKSLDSITALKTRLFELLVVAKQSSRAAQAAAREKSKSGAVAGGFAFETSPLDQDDILQQSEAKAHAVAQAPALVEFRKRLAELDRLLHK